MSLADSVISLRSISDAGFDFQSPRETGSKSYVKGKKSIKNVQHGSPYGTPTKSLKNGKKIGQSGRELWLSSVKNGRGISNEGSPMNAWKPGGSTNKTGRSTASNYLIEQLTGVQKTQRPMSATAHRAGGKGPVYKDAETYYDEIQSLKRTLRHLQEDNNLMKSKILRMEEENLAKSKKIEELLTPQLQTNDMRRTLTSKNADTSEIVLSLKRKIYKLEENLRGKENEVRKMKSEMKYTDMEELKIENNVLMCEISSLNEHITDMLNAPKETSISQEAIEDALQDNDNKKAHLLMKKLTADNQALLLENKSLKNDVKKLTQNSSVLDLNKDYEDMSRAELLKKISSLEQRIKEEEKRPLPQENIDKKLEECNDQDKRCIQLKGPLPQQIKKLRSREVELLKETDKLQSTIVKLKEDRMHYRKLTDDFRKQIDDMSKAAEATPLSVRKEMSESTSSPQPLNALKSRENSFEQSSRRSNSTSRKESTKDMTSSQQLYSLKSRENSFEQSSKRSNSMTRKESTKDVTSSQSLNTLKSSRENSFERSSRRSNGKKSSVAEEPDKGSLETHKKSFERRERELSFELREIKVQEFQEQNAAKKIQRGWRKNRELYYKQDAKGKDIDQDLKGRRKKQDARIEEFENTKHSRKPSKIERDALKTSKYGDDVDSKYSDRKSTASRNSRSSSKYKSDTEEELESTDDDDDVISPRDYKNKEELIKQNRDNKAMKPKKSQNSLKKNSRMDSRVNNYNRPRKESQVTSQRRHLSKSRDVSDDVDDDDDDDDDSDDDDDVVVGSSASLSKYRDDNNKNNSKSTTKQPYRDKKDRHQSLNESSKKPRKESRLDDDPFSEMRFRKQSNGHTSPRMSVSELKQASSPWSNLSIETSEGSELEEKPKIKNNKKSTSREKRRSKALQDTKREARPSVLSKWTTNQPKSDKPPKEKPDYQFDLSDELPTNTFQKSLESRVKKRSQALDDELF